MIALYLLVAHLIGDYLLQTRWQAVGKFGWGVNAMFLRSRHVATYCIPFAPIAFAYCSVGGAVLFLLWLSYLHWITDAQRITVTPGEWLWWNWRRPDEKLESNPWPPLPLVIDQTLHVAQLAFLGWAFML